MISSFSDTQKSVNPFVVAFQVVYSFFIIPYRIENPIVQNKKSDSTIAFLGPVVVTGPIALVVAQRWRRLASSSVLLPGEAA